MPRSVKPPTKRFLVLLLLVVMTTTSCEALAGSAQPEPARSSAAAPASVPSAAPRVGEPLVWRRCSGRLECATLTVPLDHGEPDGRTIGISLLKVPATGGGRARSLVVNPGGPGMSGRDLARDLAPAVGPEVRRRFDLVGFDPRGVGASSPLRCLSDPAQERLLARDSTTTSLAGLRRVVAGVRAVGKACLRRHPGLTRHVSTTDVARDLELLRTALGERRLDFLGFSYGTFLGATYAGLFPRRVGRMVLDGAIDPRTSTLDAGVEKARAFEEQLASFARWCARRSTCTLGNTSKQVTNEVRGLLNRIRRRPLRLSADKAVRPADAFTAVTGSLYSPTYYDELGHALSTAVAGDPRALRLVADNIVGRNADGSFWAGADQSWLAISCLDGPDPVSPAALGRALPRFDRASPTFGRFFAQQTVQCADWPVRTGPAEPLRIGRTAGPVLVIGSTGDPATPVGMALRLARQIKRSALVVRDGDGHTGYLQGSFCVDDVVTDYLLFGDVIHSRTDC